MLLLPAPPSVGPDATPVKTKPRRRRLSCADLFALGKLRNSPNTLTDFDVDLIVGRIGLARVMGSLDRYTRPSLVAAK